MATAWSVGPASDAGRAAGAGVGAGKKPGCSRADLRTVRQGTRGRVLRRTPNGEEGGAGSPSSGYYGCLFAAGRLLALDGGDSVVSHATLRGRFVALFEYSDDGAPHCEQGLRMAMFDLSRGDAYGFARQVFRDYDPRQPICPRGDVPAKPVQIVSKPNGALAWTRCTWRADGPDFAGAPVRCAENAVYEVVKHDANGNRGRGRVIDAGAGIDPRSLRLRAGRLTWSDGGRIEADRLR